MEYIGVKCADCGSDRLKFEVAYSSAYMDEDLKAAFPDKAFKPLDAGQVALVCEGCGRIYPVCYVRNAAHAAPIGNEGGVWRRVGGTT